MGAKTGLTAALALATCMAWTPAWAQAGSAGSGSSSSQSRQQQNAPEPPAPNVPESQKKGNPFPGTTTNVPVLPSGPAANVPVPGYAPEANRSAFPPGDQDPVRSPEEAAANGGSSQGFSSSLTGVDTVLPPPSEPTGKKSQQLAPMPQESPENDISVGNYYLSVKNWRAALSRFQSALVLEPNNPDVYWGLAESEQHLGDFALARAHYLKVLEYDPGSKHAKKAKKALRDPQIENARAGPARAANATQP